MATISLKQEIPQEAYQRQIEVNEGFDIACGRLCDTNRDGIVDEYRSELGCTKPLPVAFSRMKPTEDQVKLFAEATKNFYIIPNNTIKTTWMFQSN